MDLHHIDIPRLITRPMELNIDDARVICALVDAENAAAGEVTVSNAEDVLNEFIASANLEPASDILMLEIPSHDGPTTPVAYAIARTFKETDGPRVLRHMVKVHPDFLRRGIGTAALSWCYDRLVDMRISLSDPAGTEIVYRTTISYDGPGGVRLMERNGYSPVGYWAEMQRSLIDTPHSDLPPGVELRPVEDDQLRTIWEADVEAFRDHWGFVEPTEADYRNFLDFTYTDHTLWTIAWHEHEVVGQIRAFIETDSNEETGKSIGWTEDISTARHWRGKGIAGALLCESLRRLADRGLEHARLGVHTDNPNGALRLYEAHGYQEVARSTEYEKSAEC